MLVHKSKLSVVSRQISQKLDIPSVESKPVALTLTNYLGEKRKYVQAGEGSFVVGSIQHYIVEFFLVGMPTNIEFTIEDVHESLKFTDCPRKLTRDNVNAGFTRVRNCFPNKIMAQREQGKQGRYNIYWLSESIRKFEPNGVEERR